MKTQPNSGMTAGDSLRLFQLVPAVLTLLLTGCQAENLFLAESMPTSLRLPPQTNPQEVALARLSSPLGTTETIGAGDILDVYVAASLNKDDQVKIAVRVGEDGSGELPEIGRIPLAGIEPQAAESLIRTEAIRKGLFLNPSVTVSFAHRRMNRITVLGAVKEPGTIELPPGTSDLVSVIAAAGGLDEDAGENVEIHNPAFAGRRPEPISVASADTDSDGVSPVSMTASAGGTVVQTVNLVTAARQGTGSYRIDDGGVVMVEKRDPLPVTVIGLVKAPGDVDFEVGKDMKVLDAIGKAGGLSNQLADKIFIIRPLAHGAEPAVIQVSYRQAKRSGASNIRLGPGDTVSVEQTPATVLLEAMQIIRFGVNASTGTLF